MGKLFKGFLHSADATSASVGMTIMPMAKKSKKMPTVTGEIISLDEKTGLPVRQIVPRAGLPSQRPNIFIGTLNLVVRPMQTMGPRLAQRYKQHYLPSYKFGTWHLALDIALFCTVLFLVGLNFYLFSGQGIEGELPVLNIKTSATELRSGDQAVFEISYHNPSHYPLKTAHLSLLLPENFQLENVQPQTNFDAMTNTLELGNIPPGASGKVKVIGQIFGESGSGQALKATLNYWEEGQWLKQQRQQIAWLNFFIADSVFTFDILAPDAVAPGQEFTLRANYQNQGEKELERAFLVLSLPAGMELLSSEPKAEQDTWHLLNVPAKSAGIVTAKIKTAAGLGQENVLKIRGFMEKDGLSLVQRVLEKKITAIAPGLKVRQTINEQENIKITPGEELTYKIFYQNQSKEILQNVRITARLEGDYLDWDSLQGDGKKEGELMVWSLPQLVAGEKGEKIVRIKTLSALNLEPFSVDHSFNIRSTILLSYYSKDEAVNLEAASLESPVHSFLGVKTFARYYTSEGEQLGRGPLPPRVGETTKYWVFLQLKNTINPAEKVQVSAVLPKNIDWTGKTNVNIGTPLEFDAATRKITWLAGAIPSFIGIAPQLVASFEVAITPDTSQVGQEVILAEEIKITGKDQKTGALLEAAPENVTTDLIDDAKAKGQGRVVR